MVEMRISVISTNSNVAGELITYLSKHRSVQLSSDVLHIYTKSATIRYSISYRSPKQVDRSVIDDDLVVIAVKDTNQLCAISARLGDAVERSSVMTVVLNGSSSAQLGSSVFLANTGSTPKDTIVE